MDGRERVIGPTGRGILAPRRELGLKIDEEMMLSLMDAGLRENIALLDAFIGKLEDQLSTFEKILSATKLASESSPAHTPAK